MERDDIEILRRQIAGALTHVVKATGSVGLEDVARVAQLAASGVARQASGYAPSASAFKAKLRRVADLERRDGLGCFFCGVVLDAGDYTFDHDLPRSRGGTRAFGNLHLACATCNQRKGARTIAEYVASGASVLPRVETWLRCPTAARRVTAPQDPSRPGDAFIDELEVRRSQRRRQQGLMQKIADARGSDALLSGFADPPPFRDSGPL